MYKRILFVSVMSLLPLLMGCAKEEAGTSTVASETPAPVEAEVPTPFPLTTMEPEVVYAPQKVCRIEFSDYDVTFNEDVKAEATPYTLSLVSEEDNKVSQILTWYEENDLFLPVLGVKWGELRDMEAAPDVKDLTESFESVFYDDNYVYECSDTVLNIYAREDMAWLYQVEYDMDKWYLMGNCASLMDGVLYIGYLYNGYAMPNTCFMMAYDLENEKVLWRSEDQTFNTMNILIKDDVIFCGYGFTDERDYLYQIDRHTGKVIAKAELKKMPEMMAFKDNQLYIHTYSYDYVFEIK